MAEYDRQDDILGCDEQPKKRQKRFAFQSFGRRVAEVDVADVYRHGAPVRAEPLPGTGSFLQEEIQKQRELHSTSHFLTAAAAINQRAQTMPLIVHHKDAIASTLLEAVRMEAGLSLEPLLILVAALARDLQADFLPFVPRLAAALTELVQQGADREPELLQHIFGCLSSVLRHLAQWLAADMPRILQQTARLRYHNARHVRQLAAQSVGFLLRHARGKALRAGVRTIYAEQAMNPCEARTHGAGLLLAESLIGINHGLHSRAAALVPLMLQEDILVTTDLKGAKAQHRLTQDVLRDRAGQVNRVALDRLLQHTRRGCLQALWETALAEADARLARCEHAPAGGEGGAEQQSAARAVDVVAQMVEYIRGSRVDDYAPLFALSARFSESASSAAEGGPIAATASLPRAALRLVAALIAAHGKDVGASGGLAAIREMAPSWRPLLQQAPVANVIPFVRRVLHAPGAGAAAAEALGPVLLGALWHALQAGASSAALPLLLDACQALQTQVFQPADRVPLLHTAEPGGQELAEYICSMAEQPDATPAEAWAALICLQHATADAKRVKQICDRILVEGATESEGRLQLKSQALRLKAAAAPEEAATEVVAEAVAMLRGYPAQYQIISTTAELLQTAKLHNVSVPGATLEALLPLLERNLAARSQAVRGATLNLLCTCPQPPLAQQGAESGPPPDEAQLLSSIFPNLAKIENQTCTMENGRAAANMLLGLKTALEFGQVPAIQIRPVVCALLGMLHIRFSLLWAPAAEALGMALKQHPDIAWPLIVSALARTQNELLSGHGAGQAPGHMEKDQEYDGELESLDERFEKHGSQGSVGGSGGCTDASVRLSTLLKAMVHAPVGVVKDRGHEWVPLCLSYLSAKQPATQPNHLTDAPNQGADSVVTGIRLDASSAIDTSAAENRADAGEDPGNAKIGARLWRGLAKDWLALLASLKDLRGVHDSSALMRALAAQILSSDASLQQAALKGLRGFHLDYLRSGDAQKQAGRGKKHGTMDRLLRLANDATLREELTSFPLAIDAEDAIPAVHRSGVIGVLVRLLWPKMRKRSGRLGGKGAPGSARAAILNFFTALEPAELRPLLAQFLVPVGPAIRQPEDSAAEEQLGASQELFVEPWWASKPGTGSSEWWLGALDRVKLSELPGKQRVGLVNALVDLLRHLGHRLAVYLPAITAILVVLLEGAVSDLPWGTEQNPSLHAELALSPSLAPELGQNADSGMTEAQQPQTAAGEAGEAPFSSTGEQGGGDRAESEGGRESAATAAGPACEAEAAAAPGRLQGAAPKSDGGREVRSGVLRLLASVWSRFPAQHHDTPLFARFFAAVAPLMSRITTEASAPAPPPLLQCVASLSTSPKLAPLLAQHPAMLDATIAILAAPHASSASRDASLAILEAILDLEQPTQEAILQPHTEHLLRSLQRLVTSAASSGRSALPRAMKAKAKAAQKGPSRADSLRALTILERLASVQDQNPGGALVMQLSGALLPILATSAGAGRKHTHGDDAATQRVLRALAAIWSRAAASGVSGLAHTEHLWSFASDLAPLAGSLASRDSRAALAAAFAALAQLLPGLQQCSALLTDLNAMSTTEVDAMDYDRRLQAYSRLQAGAWAQMGPVQALPLLHHSLADMRRTDDLAIRSAAAQALGRLIAAGSVAGLESREVSGEDRATKLVHTVLFRQLRRTLPAGNLAVRQEHVDLLRVLALAFPIQYPDLHALTDKDAELDFFNNVAHLQLHRRSRAFKRLANACQSGIVSGTTLMGIAAPLLQQVIIEGRSGEGGHEMKDRERDQEANVVDTAVQVLGVVAQHLEWPQYQELLGMFNRAMQRTEGKAIIRAVCAIIDAFHFATELPEEPAQAAPSAEAAPPAEAAPQSSGQAPKDAAYVADIQKALAKRVLPALQKQLVYKDGEAVRAPVALAIVKLLKRLPEAALRAALPTSLQKVANLLRTRLQRIRDNARTVYVAMVEELGPQYLKFAISVLRSALPPRGYMAHVQGYTVHAVLHAVTQGAEAGALDDVINDVIPIMEAELFGQVSEEKEANAFVGGCKEAKRLRAYATYQLLARGITFRDHMSTLLQPVVGRLGEASSPKVRMKLQQLLQAAVQGVLANDSVSPSDLLLFIHGVLEAGIAAEEAAQAAAQAAAEAPGANVEAPEAAREQHLLMEMALTLLLQAINKSSRNRIDVRDAGMLGMLSGLLPFLVRAMRSRHSTVASTSLKIFSMLVPLPLPGLPEQAPQAGTAMTALLSEAPDSNAPIAQECFKLLATLLRSCSSYQPGTEELRFLLKWAFGDVEAARSKAAPFNLLKAVIARRLVVPEVYDLMDRVQELLIKSHEPSVRQQCSGMMLQFVLDYPLGARRLQHHLQFLITNLSFEHESGRQAAVDTIKALSVRFPDALIEKWAPVFFMALVVRLVNDPSAACRDMNEQALKTLLRRADTALADRLAGFCSQWLSGEDARLARAAAQTMSIFAAVEGARFGRRVPALLQIILPALQGASQEEDDEVVTDAELSSFGSWQVPYFCLTLAEKAAEVAPKQVAFSAASSLWLVLPPLLTHAHLWVRKAVLRLLSLGLSDSSIGGGLVKHPTASPGRLTLLSYQQMEVPAADEGLLALAGRSAALLAPLLYDADLAAGRVPSVQANGTSGAATDSPAAVEQDASLAADMGEADLQSGDAALADEHAAALTLHGMVRRVARLAGETSWTRQTARAAALRLLAALALRLREERGAPALLPYLSTMMLPLVRLDEQSHGGAAADTVLPAHLAEADVLGREVMAQLKAAAGDEAYLQALVQAKQHATALRRLRRKQQASEKMADPELALQKRVRKVQRRVEGQKRQREELKKQRSSGLAVKNRRDKRMKA